MNQPPPLSHPRDPLHGITPETIVNQLVERHRWAEMGRHIPIYRSMPNISLDLAHVRAQYVGATF